VYSLFPQARKNTGDRVIHPRMIRHLLALLAAISLLTPVRPALAEAAKPAPASAGAGRRGAVEEFSLPSKVLGQSRRVWVYTPPGYTAGGPDNDLLLVFDGEDYLSDIPLPKFLDSLTVAGRIPPTVAVMTDNASGAARLADLANHERFVEFIASELIPWVHRHWTVSTDPHRATVTGSSAGGLAAVFLALRHPERFGNVLSQSGAFWRGAEGSNGPPYEWVTAQVAATPRRDVRFFLDVGSTETHGALSGRAPSILEANRRLRDALVAKGYRVTYYEVPGGVHAPESWRERLPAGLAWINGGSRR
jgi:enterochelin esterase-like enzyme